MDDDQLLRYSRHILLDDIGVEGQQRLLDAHALVIGAGGLGSPAALFLGTAGVGRITLVDHDRVDVTNLQRQIAHSLARVDQPKAESAAAGIAAINPEPRVRAITERADAALLDTLVPQADDDVLHRRGQQRQGQRHQQQRQRGLQPQPVGRSDKGGRIVRCGRNGVFLWTKVAGERKGDPPFGPCLARAERKPL